MSEEENVFDENTDYTHTGETYKRDNYKAWCGSLPQDDIFKMLSDNVAGSELKLSNWEKETLADWMATIRYGKEKD